MSARPRAVPHITGKQILSSRQRQPEFVRFSIAEAQDWRREPKKTSLAVMLRTGNHDAMATSVSQAIGARGQGSPHAKSRF